MSRSTHWDQPEPSPKKRKGAKSWALLVFGGLAILVLALGLSMLRSSTESPRLASRIFQELTTDDGAKNLYRKSAGLQAGYGSEEAFLQHIHTWMPRFGSAQNFQGPDTAKRFLPFAAKLEIQGSGGAWFAVQARLEPFSKLHAVAFGGTREQARRMCFSRFAKSHMQAWLDRGLARAHWLAEHPEAAAAIGLTTTDCQELRKLPKDAKALDPAIFELEFADQGARLDLDLPEGRHLFLSWNGEGSEKEIRASTVL